MRFGKGKIGMHSGTILLQQMQRDGEHEQIHLQKIQFPCVLRQFIRHILLVVD